MIPTKFKIVKPLAPLLKGQQEKWLNYRMKKKLGRSMQNPPCSFYDKMFWMACHTDTQRWTDLADKYKVRDYVAEKCGDELLPALFGVYDSASQIAFDELPDAFVLKTNNGCAANFLVHSKKDANLNGICSELDYWLNYPYGDVTGQLHYSKIEPKIIAEELMFQKDNPEDSLVDYKFFCFDGKPAYCLVCADRKVSADGKHTYTRAMYNEKWESVEAFDEDVEITQTPKPDCLEQMLETAQTLSQGFPFVRVDLYAVDGTVKFGEMTFLPGFTMWLSDDFQSLLGSMITLPSKETVN